MRRLWPLLLLAACQPGPPDFDVLIVGGAIYDGTGMPAAAGNIGIRGDRIATLAAPSGASAGVVIDASGLIVVPGFIDPHTHAFDTLIDPATSANLNYLTQGVTTVFIGNDGNGVLDLAESFARFERQGIGTNVAGLSGHGRLRTRAMGRANRAPTDTELDTMRTMLVSEMDDGSFGLSTGLYYVPGNYAETDEVVALARVAAENGGIYDTHLRSEGSYGDGLLAAIDEAIRIAREADVAVHISHLKALGKDVWGQSGAIIQRIDAARREGLHVTANQYPWHASGTRFGNALLPRWVLADSKERTAARLRDPELLPRILEEMQANLERRGGPEAMRVSAPDSDYRGMTLAEIAAQLDKDPLNAAIEVVLGGDPSIASFVMSPADVDALATQPWVMTGSDGSSGHPRLYGTYPKAWQELVGRNRMSIAGFVYRSSGLVAETFNICRRGLIRPGFFADIAVIDPDRFIAQADYDRPTELSTGVEYLLVNGAMVIAENNYNDSLPGRALRLNDCDD